MASLEEAFRAAVRMLQAGKLPQAEQLCRQILAAAPSHADALHVLGVAAGQQGRGAEAIEYLRRAIAVDDRRAAYHSDLAVAYAMAARVPEAIACLERALQLDPHQAPVYKNLALIRRKQGRLDEAIACYQRAVQFSPDDVATYNDLASAYREQGKLEETAACYQRVVEQRPADAEAHSNLGVAWHALGRAEEAAACFRQALALDPDQVAALHGLGVVFYKQGKLDEAIACYRRALEIRPDYAEAYSNMGVAYKEQGELDAAIGCYQRALELRADYAEAHSNLGTARQAQGKIAAALASYQRALELKPEYVEAHVNRALAYLLGGDFARGWPEYEWRWQQAWSPPRSFPQPRWEGAPGQGQTILLHADRGLGDTIQFIRYAQRVQRRGFTVIVECPGLLLRLFSRCAGIDRLVARGERLPPFDCHCPLLSLPGIFQTTLETIPHDVPYLAADPELVEPWRERLVGCAGYRVGIAWQGNRLFPADALRSVPLAQFAPLAAVPGVCLLSVQKGPGTEQLAAREGAWPVEELGSRLDDFADTAAVMMHLDLVITCDTSVAHLAGALGIPVWVALPFAPDWRWLLDRDDSPWYPSMRLFRQTRWGDWAGVFRRMQEALRQRRGAGISDLRSEI